MGHIGRTEFVYSLQVVNGWHRRSAARSARKSSPSSEFTTHSVFCLQSSPCLLIALLLALILFIYSFDHDGKRCYTHDCGDPAAVLTSCFGNEDNDGASPG
jgi:hypothetical protein